MQTKPLTTVSEAQLIGHFERLRSKLLEPNFADRLTKPLAYWTLMSDRRLPHAFLDRKLGELIQTPFAELCATSGVGHKKMVSLITLLTRATQDNPPAPSTGTWNLEGSSNGLSAESSVENGVFNPAVVSEVLWACWCETVKEHGLGHQLFGRLAPTLINLPSAIWNTPLDEYVNRTLAEIRHLKTHGEKRVNSVLEVFFTVHETLANGHHQDHFDVQLVPRFIGPLESWIAETQANDHKPSRDEVLESLTKPLLDQLNLDAGQAIYSLAADRLGIECVPQSVRNQAKELGVTRARVYQLLEECSKVMAVRWPEGERLVRGLLRQLQSAQTNIEATRLVSATVDLFYPPSQPSDITKIDSERALAPSPCLVQ